MGAMGFGPGPLVNRPHPTWPASPIQEPRPIYPPLLEKESLCSACHLSRLETLFSKCCRVNSPEENMHPSMNHANNITRGEQALSGSSIRQTQLFKRKN